MSDDELIERVARALADVSYTGANIVLDAQLAEGEVQEMARAILPFIHEARIEGGKMVQEACARECCYIEVEDCEDSIRALSVEDIVKEQDT